MVQSGGPVEQPQQWRQFDREFPFVRASTGRADLCGHRIPPWRDAARHGFEDQKPNTFPGGLPLHVRTASDDPYTLLQSVRRELDGLDRDLPLSRVMTLAERLDRSLGAQRTAAMLVGIYGMLALVLATVGLYGSMAYAVSRRTREMGVRMALGARAAEVRRHVIAGALRVTLVGTAIGLAAAVPATRLLRSQLFGVSPVDPATLVSVVVILAAASVAAAYLPARRATRVDPVIALRSE